MESQPPLDLDTPGNDDEYEATTDEDWLDIPEPEPEPVLTDAAHDKVVLLLALCISVGALALLLSFGVAESLGLSGSSCTTGHLRIGVCVSADSAGLAPTSYLPTPQLPQLDYPLSSQ